MKENIEQQLLQDMKNGSRTAMRQFYNLYSGYAMAIILRYVPDRDDAADILQDAFLKIFTSIDKFYYRGEGKVKAWMSRIVANEALTFLRRHGNLVFTDEIPDLPDESPDVEGIPDKELRTMIAALPEGYRVVLNLYVFGQMSHKEIADELGISPSTSASQFFHAKKILAQMIKTYREGKLQIPNKERRHL